MSSGQIIATSHDRFPPNSGLAKETPLFPGNLGWWNIIIWQDVISESLRIQPSWSWNNENKSCSGRSNDVWRLSVLAGFWIFGSDFLTWSWVAQGWWEFFCAGTHDSKRNIWVFQICCVFIFGEMDHFDWDFQLGSWVETTNQRTY